ncbi:MAG: membrane protein insertion efficiency factor YidD [Rhizobiales bacterium]|nr:membrane protein insertion efficiency factor YidD [Hyphomicrobiales bacterium]
MKAILIAAIRFYQLTLSAFTGRRCRYLPTCSEYASEAIEKHGSRRGLLLAISRVSRCQPWGGEGFDPVPDVYDGPLWRMKKGAPKDP